METEPQINDDLVAFLSDINKLVSEVTAESTTGSSNDDTSVLDENIDYNMNTAKIKNKPPSGISTLLVERVIFILINN